jgi:serine protease inhibitor
MEGASAVQSDPLDVRIDRPFLFAIRDTTSGTLLFLGRVLSPES